MSNDNAYMREYMLARYHRRRKEAILYLGGTCTVCGIQNVPLEFDHIDPHTKLGTIAKIWSYSEDKFWAEVSKCQLLCQPCHVAKTIAEKGLRAARGTHGTASAYRWCGPPKCAACKAAKMENQRKCRGLARARARGEMESQRIFNPTIEGSSPSEPTKENPLEKLTRLAQEMGMYDDEVRYPSMLEKVLGPLPDPEPETDLSGVHFTEDDFRRISEED